MRKVSMRRKRESFLVVSCRALICLSLCSSLVLISHSRQTRVVQIQLQNIKRKQELPRGTWSNCHALLYFLTSFHSPGRPRTGWSCPCVLPAHRPVVGITGVCCHAQPPSFRFARYVPNTLKLKAWDELAWQGWCQAWELTTSLWKLHGRRRKLTSASCRPVFRCYPVLSAYFSEFCYAHENSCGCFWCYNHRWKQCC